MTYKSYYAPIQKQELGHIAKNTRIVPLQQLVKLLLVSHLNYQYRVNAKSLTEVGFH